MKNYADYTFYKEEYKGSLSIDLFSSYIIKASRIIDRNINRELTDEVMEELTETEKWKVKYVACGLCDYLNTSETSGVSSVSIDGVSKTYQTNTELEANKNDVLKDLPIKLTRYL